MQDYYEKKGALREAAWIINYDADRALHNYYFLAGELAQKGNEWPNVYASRDCAAIVVANCALDEIRDPHVMAWRNSFFRLSRFEFLQRVAECLDGRRRFLGAEPGTCASAA